VTSTLVSLPLPARSLHAAEKREILIPLVYEVIVTHPRIIPTIAHVLHHPSPPALHFIPPTLVQGTDRPLALLGARALRGNGERAGHRKRDERGTGRGRWKSHPLLELVARGREIAVEHQREWEWVYSLERAEKEYE
jgi:hypothetical protein